jgi:hypothetical protein
MYDRCQLASGVAVIAFIGICVSERERERERERDEHLG